MATPENRITKIAILAVGGQGGGVLSDWIVSLAEQNGYRAQATSVAGVAQRTGSTIYYIEMAVDDGRDPVFALAPAAGDVDIVIAAELMEAGRAVMRGFVGDEQTTLIASTHRAYAVSEKSKPGNGIANAETVMQAARRSSKRFIAFDMEQLAVQAGSVISASLMGALAGAEVLPFEADAFEKVVQASPRGAQASFRAFQAARRSVLEAEPESVATESGITANPSGPPALVAQWCELASRVDSFPLVVQPMAVAGLKRVVDYQDIAYGDEYLSRLESLLASDRQHDGESHGFNFSIACAKHLANAMAYDDVIRVADLKTRQSRMQRIQLENAIDDSRVMQITEFFHPRGEEFCGLFPARLGGWVDSQPERIKLLDRLVNRGLRIRTDTMSGFTRLYLVSVLRRWRRKLWRHQVEMAHVKSWQELAQKTLLENYDLAVQVINCRRLIKGYSDTHARGHSRFSRVIDSLPRFTDRPDAATIMQQLIEAALTDETGKTLDLLIKDI